MFELAGRFRTAEADQAGLDRLAGMAARDRAHRVVLVDEFPTHVISHISFPEFLEAGPRKTNRFHFFFGKSRPGSVLFQTSRHATTCVGCGLGI